MAHLSITPLSLLSTVLKCVVYVGFCWVLLLWRADIWKYCSLWENDDNVFLGPTYSHVTNDCTFIYPKTCVYYMLHLVLSTGGISVFTGTCHSASQVLFLPLYLGPRCLKCSCHHTWAVPPCARAHHLICDDLPNLNHKWPEMVSNTLHIALKMSF